MRDRLRGVYPKSQPATIETPTSAFACSPDGAKVVCANGNTAELWDMTTGKRIRSFQHPEVVIRVALSPRSDLLLTATAGRKTPVRQWDVETGKVLRKYPSPFAESAAVEPAKRDSKGVASMQLWMFKFDGAVSADGFGFTSIAFDSTADRVAAGCEDGTILIWNAKTCKAIDRIAGKANRISSVAFARDGSRLLVAAKGDIIQLWNLQTRAMIRQYDENREDNWVQGYRPSIAFCSDGSKFAFYGPRSRAIFVCDSKTGKEICRLPEDSCAPACPSNTTAVAPYEGGKLAISQEPGLSFLPEGNCLLSHVGWILKVWDIRSRTCIHRHVRRSGVNWGYAYPNVEYVQYLPDVDSAIAVELENDENTGHDFWTTISYVPLSQFEDVPQRK